MKITLITQGTFLDGEIAVPRDLKKIDGWPWKTVIPAIMHKVGWVRMESKSLTKHKVLSLHTKHSCVWWEIKKFDSQRKFHS